MAQFQITDDLKMFLCGNFIEYSFKQDDNGNDLKADRALFETINRPEEIFFLAQSCNWDDGAVIPCWIVDSPLCTKAAALTIFWQSAPYEYMEHDFGSKIVGWCGGVDEEQTEILNLLERLVKRFERNDFHPLSIKFDFSVWGGKLLVKDPKWSVPNEFFCDASGIEII